MTSAENSLTPLRKLIRRRPAVRLEDLFAVLGTRSRMTVFRRLKEIGYRTSFTHAGRYYTLSDIPVFDELGLWFHKDAGFSVMGNLKESVAWHVEKSLDGRTHAELQHILRVRVHNPLLDLVRQGRIGRKNFGRMCLYTSANSARATAQVDQRRELSEMMAQACRVLNLEETLEVLAEALRAAPEIPTVPVLASRLASRGLRFEPRLVQQVFDTHGLVPGKKKRPRASFPDKGADAGS
jgi:hypothetical protein